MANTIIIKNGNSAPGTVLQVAELGYDKTGKKLYSGNGTGNEATCINPFNITDTESTPEAGDIIDADTLGGIPASDYAKTVYVDTQIENALIKLHNQIITGAW